MPKILGTGKSRTFRVLWMLEEIGVAYDHLPIPPQSPEIKEINASGKVPVYIEDDGTILTDSTAIMTYLGDRHGKLTMPAGTTDRAAQDSMTFAILDELDGALWTAARHSFILPKDLRLPQIKDSLKWEFAKSADRLGQRIRGPFVMGEQMTIPDILLAHCTNWATNAKFDVQSAPLIEHLNRLIDRPAYVRARAL